MVTDLIQGILHILIMLFRQIILQPWSEDKSAVNQVYNVAHGERTSLNELFELIRQLIGRFDSEVMSIKPVYGPTGQGIYLIPWLQLKRQKASWL